MEQFIQNMLIGIRQWVNWKIADVNTAIESKQDVLTAGNNIEITSGGTISVTGIINDSVSGNNSTYSSGKILELVNEIKQFKIEVVAKLPASGETYTIYLTPSQESGATNSRDEYLWIVDASTGKGSWEIIGTTKTDLSGYYTETEVNELLDEKQNVLKAGNNIEITSGGTISAIDTTYEASDFDIKDLTDSAGLREKWSGKQDALTAGNNIEITSAGTINVTGMTSATEQALEDMSFVVSNNINELNTKIDGKQDKVNVTVEEVLEVLNGSV